MAPRAVAALAIFASFCVVSGAKHPTILFIVADDLGWEDVGFRNNNQIKTPNINAAAQAGVTLDQYYVQCVCSPSRATFMTGRYPLHTGINEWIPPACGYGLPLNETTLADKLKGAGYATHAVGKWHLGFFQEEYTPTFRGFDSFYGFYSGGEDYFQHVSSGGYDFRNDSSPRCGKGCSQVAWQDQGAYSTEVFTREALKVVAEHDPSSGPLFLYLAYQAVHAPRECPEKYVSPYNDTIADPHRREFAGMLSAMDEGIGQVTAALGAKGMLDDFLAVFTTDNGGPTTTGDGIGARNWPLRGGKHSIYEGGTRGTAVAWGTGFTKRGYTNTNLMHAADWLPTILSFAGVPATGTLPLDGVDQWDSISSNGSAVRSEVLYGEDSTLLHNGLRQGDWKLLLGGGGKPDTWYPPVNASQAAGGGDAAGPGARCAQLVSGPAQAGCSDARAAASSCATPGYTDLSAADGAAAAADNDDDDGQCRSGRSTGAAPSCDSPQAGVCYPGNDIRHFNASSVAACCAECGKTQHCVAYTMRANATGGGPCYLKTKAGSPAADPHCVSGGGAGSAAELYNVATDPTEHHEVSKANPQIVAQMKQRLAAILAGGVPNAACDNPKCPPVVKPKNPHVGPVWAPWC